MHLIKKVLINSDCKPYNNCRVISRYVYYNINYRAGIILIQIGMTIENFTHNLRITRSNEERDHIDIILAGIGRCGTSMVNNSLWATYRTERSTYPSFNIRKTHSWNPSMLLSTIRLVPIWPTKNTKIIWMFGNPMNIVISSNNLGRGGALQHYFNTQSPNYKQHSKRFTQDTLLLEKNFDAWYKPQKFEFLSVKYEGLRHQKNRDAIEDFLGFKSDLSAWKERVSDWRTHPKKEELVRTYGRLAEKIEAAEDVKWWKPANS